MVVRPKSVRIGPHVYKILYSQKSWRKYLGKTAEKQYAGKTHTLRNRIFINAFSMSLSQQQETLLHEILHAVLAVTGWTDDEYGWPTESRDLIEEHLIRQVAPIFLQILQDNPDLVEWLNVT